MYESTSHKLKSQLFSNTIIQNLLFSLPARAPIINTVHVTICVPSLVSALNIDLYLYRYTGTANTYRLQVRSCLYCANRN